VSASEDSSRAVTPHRTAASGARELSRAPDTVGGTDGMTWAGTAGGGTTAGSTAAGNTAAGSTTGGGTTAGGTTAGGTSMGGIWQRNRIVVLLLLGVVLIATAIAVTQAGGAGGRLDPRSAKPDGGRALAELLGDRGVRVDRVTDRAALVAGADDRTAIFVAFPRLLRDDLGRAVGEVTSGTVMLVSPPADVLEAVTDDIRRESAGSVEVRDPGCAEPAAQAAGRALVGGTAFSAGDGVSCYQEDGDYAPLVTGRTRGGARLVVIGTGQPFTNQELDQEGNAALGLNLLGAGGSTSELRWLVPAPGGSSGDDSLSSILPGWVVPAALQLLLAGLLLALWRGRRLGPPVAEPLPVVVRAAEAVEGRARLYRRAQARDRASAALRAGALARLVPRLGIDSPAGGEPAPEAVVAAVASRSGRPDAEVHAGLYGPPPTNDAGLVRLADTLDSMVRSTLDPEGPHQ
jgi:hypothetical protein